jgi:hypothetical protein
MKKIIYFRDTNRNGWCNKKTIVQVGLVPTSLSNILERIENFMYSIRKMSKNLFKEFLDILLVHLFFSFLQKYFLLQQNLNLKLFELK